MPSEFCTQSTAHIPKLYSDCQSLEHVTVAEVNDAPANGFRGMRQLHCALVPLSEVDEVLAHPGGVGWEVECWGPRPCVDEEGGYDGSFWIAGSRRDRRYEPLVHAWTNHNRSVLVPDNGFLMCYGLVPRMPGSGRLSWDDPSGPVHEVVAASPESRYDVSEGHTLAYVKVRPDYLSDYLSLKGCAAVAVFYEQRYSKGDGKFEEMLGDELGKEFSFPGRRTMLKRVTWGTRNGCDQLTEIWGCQLIMRPHGRPVSDDEYPVLKWPDCGLIEHPSEASEKLGPLGEVYVEDGVLRVYENREEYEIMPKLGAVSHGGWWSVGHCRRVGRNHIAVELRKLYEGCRPNVVRHFHEYAVPRAKAEADERENGDRNVGVRAQHLLCAYLDMVDTIACLANALGLHCNGGDVGGIDRQVLDYEGWWRDVRFAPLGHTIPEEMPEADFLGRCLEINKLLDHLRPKPMKTMLEKMGLEKAIFTGWRSFRLLATLCQLAQIAAEDGDDLLEDGEILIARWNEDEKLDCLRPIFALNQLRQSKAHSIGSGSSHKEDDDPLAVFGIERSSTAVGWGRALDNVYDRLIEALVASSKLLKRSTARL